MRTPAKIGSFYFTIGRESEFSKKDFLQILNSAIEDIVNSCTHPGILLSGGVDSSLLAIIATKYCLNIPCFVVGDNIMNPDVQAAMQLAEEKKLNLYVHLLNPTEISRIQKETKAIYSNIYEGDDCVFAALEFASPFVTDLIATDGIDELMGGYWGHRDRKRFPDIKDAFKHFWDELEEKHLTPMNRSAECHGLDLIFIYLLPEIIEQLSRISLKNRIRENVSKAVWKEIALMAGVPSWIIERKKQGFVDAFKE